MFTCLRISLKPTLPFAKIIIVSNSKRR